MSDIAYIILDDIQNPSVPGYGFYQGAGWIFTSSTFMGYYQETYSKANGTASLLVRYVGISFTLYGTIFTAEEFSTLDAGDEEPETIRLGSNCPARGPLYVSPENSATGIRYFDFSDGTEVDYMVVAVSDETDLRGQTILVDDSSPEIHWRGQHWTEERLVDSNDDDDDRSSCGISRPKMIPHGNGTHNKLYFSGGYLHAA
ncbi:hypothetical protein VKT23_009271 [Stygiomarasmius scandens]|uniref:Uncharacterized protein n=1 Tax=Marasmiellus scandens TaxID=2682957 RepID=A0ABR1JFR6_9AGAR